MYLVSIGHTEFRFKFTFQDMIPKYFLLLLGPDYVYSLV